MKNDHIRLLMIAPVIEDFSWLQAKVGEEHEITFTLAFTTCTEEALRHLRSQACDVVLLSAACWSEMLAQIVKEDVGVPIIILVDADREVSCYEALQRGAQDLLIKADGSGKWLTRAIAYTVAQKRIEAANRRAKEVAHDINNALSPILGFSEIILNSPELLASQEHVQNYLQMIHISAKEASSIVQRLRGLHEPVTTLTSSPAQPLLTNTLKEAPGQMRRLSVLVVEDEPSVRVLVTTYLESDGHKAKTATNGTEGLAQFTTGDFDLVITDEEMPLMKGSELAIAIKRQSPQTPVILLTGFGDMMRASGEKPQGVDVVVGKPITLETFRQTLQQTFRGDALQASFRA